MELGPLRSPVTFFAFNSPVPRVVHCSSGAVIGFKEPPHCGAILTGLYLATSSGVKASQVHATGVLSVGTQVSVQINSGPAAVHFSSSHNSAVHLHLCIERS